MSIDYSGRIIAELSLAGFSAIPGYGLYRLIFHFSCQVNESNNGKYIVRGLIAQVSAGRSHDKTKLLGKAIPERPIVIQTFPHSHRNSISFYLDLTPAQIEALEEVRKGEDLFFCFDMKGEGYKDDQHWEAWDQLTIPVNRKTWTDVLRQIGYADFLLFEIPVPHSNSPAELKNAIASLEKARDHFLAGSYDDTVANCRKSLESIEKGLNEETAQKEAVRHYQRNRDEMSKEERQLFLREALKRYTHLAHHTSETGANFRFDRAEANMVMGVTAALVSHAMQRIRNFVGPSVSKE
ncbi:MAG: hypothetical protein CVU57_01010 [Deltaproteobacteria bacterium HGW-Deltaproteobacteria-15]|jgi:hypothetical protein|nr:MAG: hypothetical protein CVU57_01010 [Deltaproteobacteria bacterium HGW-Deltaproteobacteria-15]